MFTSQRRLNRTTRKKHNRRAREVKREVEWATSPVVSDFLQLGERWEAEETPFESSWDESKEPASTPLPASWLRNRTAFHKWQAEEDARIAEEMKPHRGFTRVVRQYKKGVNTVFRGVRNLIMRHKLTSGEQDFATAVVAAIDGAEGEAGDEFEDVQVTVRDVEVTRRKPRTGNHLWWVKYAILTRSEHPELQDTAAMRRTVHRYAMDLMKEDKVTRMDIARVIDLVVETAYVPMNTKVKAAKLRESKSVRERLWDVTNPYWSYWWGVGRRGRTAD